MGFSTVNHFPKTCSQDELLSVTEEELDELDELEELEELDALEESEALDELEESVLVLPLLVLPEEGVVIFAGTLLPNSNQAYSG